VALKDLETPEARNYEARSKHLLVYHLVPYMVTYELRNEDKGLVSNGELL
jgi:hypothetical protein